MISLDWIDAYLTYKLFVTFQITAMRAVYQSPIDHKLKLIDEEVFYEYKAPSGSFVC